MNLPLDLSSSNHWLPLVMFIVVSSITPGPNNVMLTASGANFGYQRSVPHMLGISVGTSVQLLMVGAGLGAVFTQQPQFYAAVQWLGAAYLIWLAWKIASAGRMQTQGGRVQPLNFWQAAAFQWVNPKAWLMSIGVVAAYTSPQAYWPSLLLSALLMPLVNYPASAYGHCLAARLAAGCSRAGRCASSMLRWPLCCCCHCGPCWQ